LGHHRHRQSGEHNRGSAKFDKTHVMLFFC
jgi:hypothetical protein